MALLTLPIGIKVITLVLSGYETDQKLMQALALNVIMVLAVPFLVSLGIIIGTFY